MTFYTRPADVELRWIEAKASGSFSHDKESVTIRCPRYPVGAAFLDFFGLGPDSVEASGLPSESDNAEEGADGDSISTWLVVAFVSTSSFSLRLLYIYFRTSDKASVRSAAPMEPRRPSSR